MRRIYRIGADRISLFLKGRVSTSEGGVPLYSSLLKETPATTLAPDKTFETVEVLWWSPQNRETDAGRYEVRYNQGFTVRLDDFGGETWDKFYQSSDLIASWRSPVYWAGMSWHWNGAPRSGTFGVALREVLMKLH